MRSAAWQERRRLWFAVEAERAGGEAACAVCGTVELLQLHHHDYARMGAERHGDLVAMCKADHREFHLIWDSSVQWRRMPRAVGSPALVTVMATARRRRGPGSGRPVS